MLISQGCKSTKLVPQGQHLLVKNEIKSIDSSNNLLVQLTNSLNNDKAIYIKHKPNRKLLQTIRFYLSIYNFGSSYKNPFKNETKKWRRYLRKIGEAPVILDTLKVQRSVENLRNHLLSVGYYKCAVKSKITYRKKKAKVTYYVSSGNQYVIDTVTLSADDAELDKLLNGDMKNSLLKPNAPVNIDEISNERTRITDFMRNNGYFDFSKDFIDFELDTLKRKYGKQLLPYHVRINIFVSNKANGERFLPQTIHRIYVNFENENSLHNDSAYQVYDSMYYAANGYPLNPNIIRKFISLRAGQIYRQDEVEQTYNRLSELPIFKFIGIQFVPDLHDSDSQFDMVVNLRTNYRHSFTIEPQAIASQLNRIQNVNFSNSYGVANNLVYANKNVFRNAEQLEISATTRLESPLNSLTGFFDLSQASAQQAVNFSLILPRSSLLLILEKKIKTIKSIKTNINTSFLYEFNPDYVRRVLPLAYQYHITTRRFNWFANIGEVSFSRSTLKGVDLTNRKDSAFIRQIFANNMLTASGINFIFSDKAVTKSRTSFYIRTNMLEFGGNAHRFVRHLVDTKHTPDTSYKVLGVNYFQYIKSEVDARCSTVLDQNISTALRLNFGIGYPYGNQKVLPFDKLFFIGGSNSLRGWQPRTIGPGSYMDSSKSFRIDRAGDIIFQSSAEFRFDFIEPLELAFFMDMGNVWLSRANAGTNPRKVFKPGRFFTDMAINTGVGFRVDFSFFILRLDWGWQVRNPEKPSKDRWVINNFLDKGYFKRYSLLNFGIGYPF